MSRSARHALLTVLSACAASLLAPAAASAREGQPPKTEEDLMAETIKKAARGHSSRDRIEALRKLSGAKDPQVIRQWNIVDVLVEASDDGNPRVARTAVSGLGSLALGADPAIKQQARAPLIKLLQNGEKHVLARKEAARQLGRMTDADRYEDSEAINALLKVAAPGPKIPVEVVREALIALGAVGSPKAKQAIRSALTHRDLPVQEAGLKALRMALGGKHAAEFPDPALGGTLVRMLNQQDTTQDMREDVMVALGLLINIGVQVREFEKQLIGILETEERESTVLEAVRVVGLTGSSDAAAALVKVYARFRKTATGGEGGNIPVRSQVCITAGDMFEMWSAKSTAAGGVGAAKPLVDLLVGVLVEDPSDDVRKEAAHALGYLYDDRYDKVNAVQALIAVLSAARTTDALVEVAADSLEVLTNSSSPGKDAARWAEWFDRHKRELGPRR